jgi:hypothetical protein
MPSQVFWNPGPLYAKILSAHAEAVRAAGADAKRAAPRVTGKLSGSVRAVASAPGRGAIIASARYAPFVERGTRLHGPAQPYLRPAAARFPNYYRLMAAKRLLR